MTMTPIFLENLFFNPKIYQHIPPTTLTLPRHRTTVASELKNRDNCREGLNGVQVLIDGTNPPHTITSNDWGPNDTLEVILDGYLIAPPHRLALASPWPVCCCTPKRMNRYNSQNQTFIYEADLIPPH